MQAWWNKVDGNDTCLLVFNGWGMDENAWNELSAEDFDICVCSNYGAESSLPRELSAYKTINVIAWSLGVSYAHKYLAASALPIQLKVAINGTPFPKHGDFGIPDHVFESTLRLWNEINRKKFNRRMVGGQKQLQNMAARLSKRSIESQLAELAFFNAFKAGDDSVVWDKVLIGSSDTIVPTRNQINYWEGKAAIIEKNWFHFPFFTNEFLQELFSV